jgi:hypothetical protein
MSWWGRNFNKDGISYDPKFIQCLIDLPSSRRAAELQKFLAGAN